MVGLVSRAVGNLVRTKTGTFTEGAMVVGTPVGTPVGTAVGTAVEEFVVGKSEGKGVGLIWVEVAEVGATEGLNFLVGAAVVGLTVRPARVGE